MKKTLSLFFILAISVLLIACEPPSIGEEAIVEPAISLSSSTLNLNVGESKPLGVTVQGFAASQLRYVSEDTSIATVNTAGVVTAITPGATVVTASYEGLSETVVVFVLPEVEVLQVEVVDVQLNADNEIILIYSDGTVENTGVQGVVEAAEPVTITSTVVNAQGNLIITLSDGTTYNAGRVVGPAGPTGASGGGGTGPQGPPGPQGPEGPAGGIGTVTSAQLLSALGITSAQWDFMTSQSTLPGLLSTLGISESKWNQLINLDLTTSGFRTLLGLTDAQLEALLDVEGLISYNRYKKLYPGYPGTESEWFLELNNGDLDIVVEFDLRTELGEIFYAASTDHSGLHGTDYVFVGAASNNNDLFAINATIFVGTTSQWDQLEPMEKFVIEFGSVTRMNELNATWESQGLSQRAFKNIGLVYTLKGALLNPNEDYPNAAAVFSPDYIFPEYSLRIQHKGWVVTSGVQDNSGLFVLSNSEIQATYEPKVVAEIFSTDTGSASYFTNTSNIVSFLNNYNLTRTIAGSGLFIEDNLVDYFEIIVGDQSDYFDEYYIPPYPSVSPLYGSSGTLNIVFDEAEQFYLVDSSDIGGPLSRDLIFSDYRDSMRFVQLPGSLQGTLQSNNLTKWDVFFTAVGSGLASVRTSGIVASSGFNLSKPDGITNGSGFIQLTSPIVYRDAFVNASTGFGFFQNSAFANVNGVQEFTFNGVVYSGLNSTFTADSRNTANAVSSDIGDFSAAGPFEEGDLLFVRTEINITGEEQVATRFMYVIDVTAPLVEPIALISSNQGVLTTSFDGFGRRSNIAKAGDLLDIVILVNEPVSYNYTEGTTPIFETSGLPMSSGFGSLCGTGQSNVGNCVVRSAQTGYSTYLFNNLRVPVSKNDREGFFGFSGLLVQDRAGNDTSIDSADFTGFTNIYVDPVAVAITGSGFTNTSFFYSGITGTPIESSGVTPTSGVGNIELLIVSGIFDYSVTMFERFTEITSGAVDIFIDLRPSAQLEDSGLKPGRINSGFLSKPTVEFSSSQNLQSSNQPSGTVLPGTAHRLFNNYYNGISSGVNTLSHGFDTSGLENGLYTLEINMTDFAGNFNSQIFYLYVVNPLQYVEATVNNIQESIVSVDFSTSYIVSGTLEANDFIIKIISSSGGVETRNFTINTEYVISAPGGKSILLSVKGTGGVIFDFRPGDYVDVQITASGRAKLFNTLDEPLINEANSIRIVKDGWPSTQ